MFLVADGFLESEGTVSDPDIGHTSNLYWDLDPADTYVPIDREMTYR